MLKELKVKNFAIIEDIEVKFNKDMTVLTGQTGAGKSLIIDAISLILGARADLDMIRYGENESLITAVITDLSDEAIEALKNIGVDVKNEVTIVRQISNNNKSYIKINNQSVSLTQLKQISLFIGDIHVQHDTYRLINKDNYLSFLDDFKDKKFRDLYNKYQIDRVNYLNMLKKYNDCLKKSNDLNDKIDFLTFQKEELEALNLETDTDIKLEAEIEKLSNFDKIYTALNEAYYNLSDEKLNIDYLYDAAMNLKKIAEFDSEYLNSNEVLTEAYYALSEVKSYLYKAKDELDFDPDYLDELNSRLYEINKIKEKYKMTNNELIEYLDKISLELSLVTNFEETINSLKLELKDKHSKLVGSATKLSELRKKIAVECEKELIKECNNLDLLNTKFEIKFSNVDLTDISNHSIFLDNGIDTIDFYITFNKGEPLKPLSKVASGGELSRVMLAFKAIYLKKNNISFMIFDEIDSGVSGLTARKIALKMHEISQKTQVLAITHLPQVASIADTQLKIMKEEVSGRTTTSVKDLNYDERITEIAIMLSGLELSSSIIQTAKTMLDSFRL
jgi:DNA repair protein RecN (Recombination protein N)